MTAIDSENRNRNQRGDNMNDIAQAAADATPNLNKALAAFQAEAPKIIKDEVGVIPGKDGKQGYRYNYADLATVNAVVLPVLGKHGLSVFAKPGFAGNQFGIVCKLKHSSGEEEVGFYPLPASGTPQQMGSAITYARRYSTLMMTGLAPADDDDDAAAANSSQRFAPQSAAAAFEDASPVSPRPQAAADEAVIADWGAKIDEIANAEDAARVDGELREVFKAGRMDPTTANAIRAAIKTKKGSLTNGREMAGAAK